MNDPLDLLALYVGRLCRPIALQDSPDAAQEALIAIFRRLGQLREPAALFGWLWATAVREAVRAARRSQAIAPQILARISSRRVAAAGLERTVPSRGAVDGMRQPSRGW